MWRRAQPKCVRRQVYGSVVFIKHLMVDRNFDGHELWVEHGPFKIWGYFRKTHLNLSYSPKKDS